jgi:23S rRNA pseudouridine1911/1915/1917 synthase
VSERLTWTAPPGAPRLDRALAEAFPALSRARIQALIAEGRVQVDGAPAKASVRLPAGASVVLDVPPILPPTVEGERIPLEVLYEDEDVIVVVKPAHMVVHPSAGHGKGTLVHALVGRGGPLSAIGGVERPGIVHRLDAGTSGVMVVARNDVAHRRLSDMFARHDLDRRYLAVVHRVPLHDGGTAVSAIARDPQNRLRMASVPERTDVVYDDGYVFEEDEDEGYVVQRATIEEPVAPRQGRRAITHWRVRARGDRVALVECKLETGRTHQVRVHLSEMGHPIVSDSLYGRRECVAPGHMRAQADAVDHPLLHAFHLSFAHPRSGQHLSFTTVPPADFLGVCAAAGLPVPERPGPF